MAFTKETAKKGGEKSTRDGIPNKTTQSLRERVNNLLGDNWNRLLEDIEEISPKERLDFFTKLFEYSLPKLNRTEVNDISERDYISEMSAGDKQKRINELLKITHHE
jgi:hypothetical protein